MEKELQEELIRIGKAIEEGNCSYSELAFLQDHKQEVLEIGDARLCEQAGITEEEYNNGKLNPNMEKAQALAKFLEISIEDLEIPEDTELPFVVLDTGANYAVLTEEQADARAKEEILESLWAFNADFVISHCKNYNDMDQWEFNSAVESLRHAQENCCENANGLVRALIADIDEFVEDAIDADGRGHFIAYYDGVENEQDGYYIYRVG
jgi:transcriptional regulator with XRE-family HTH domain